MNRDKRIAVWNPKSKSYETTLTGTMVSIIPELKFTATKGTPYNEVMVSAQLADSTTREIRAKVWQASLNLHTDRFKPGQPVEIVTQTTRDKTSGKVRTFCKVQLPSQFVSLDELGHEVQFEEENDSNYDGLTDAQLKARTDARAKFQAAYKAEQELAVADADKEPI